MSRSDAPTDRVPTLAMVRARIYLLVTSGSVLGNVDLVITKYRILSPMTPILNGSLFGFRRGGAPRRPSAAPFSACGSLLSFD